MSEVRIQAEPRTEFGKGAARRIRRADKVPGVLYGHGADPRHLSLPGHELMLALKAPNVLLRLEGLADGQGGAELALPKAIQRHPVKGVLEHVDLLLVRRGEKVGVEVPITVIGEVHPDAMLSVLMNSLPVQAEATNIPTGFTVDVEGYEIGHQVSAGDVELPDGVELDTDAELLVLNVIPAPTAEQLEAEMAEAEAEAGIERELSDEEEAAEAAAAAEGEGAEGESGDGESGESGSSDE